MDSSKYEVFARCLQAASGAPCLEKPGMLYLVHEEDNDLMEELMNGPELLDQDIITSEVKPDTPAAYLYASEKQRFAFCVDEDNILKHYVFNGNWSEASLGPVAGQKLHPEGKLHACFIPGGLQVYFQDPSGALRGLVQQKGVWKDLGVVPAKPREGTPLFVRFTRAQPAVSLYYMDVDESLHFVKKLYPDGKWEENTFPESTFEEPIQNFLVMEAGAEEEIAVFFLSSDKVIRVEAAGRKVEIGSIEGSVFKPSKTDQFFDGNVYSCCVQ